MPSSTSSSRHPALFYAKVLFAICASLTIALEGATSYLMNHYSATYSRVSGQYAEALKARPAKSGEPASVLMVGNSLLLYGVDVDRFRTLTSGRMRVYPIFLEATGYYDWLYGLQKLFREGARPQVVVLGVGMNELFANNVRRDYAPMMFLNSRDVFDVASELRLDRTETSNLLLAHSSAFWDIRGAIRIQVLRHTIPHCQELFSMLQAEPRVPDSAQFAEIVVPRLERLRALCEAHGAKLIILVPPAPASADYVTRFTEASRKIGVETLVPLDPASLSTRYFLPDEIHLNPEGAQLFTAALATFLPQRLVPHAGQAQN